MGRPSKLTPEVQKRIYALISQSACTIEAAAAAAGISASTLHEWRVRGMVEKSGPFSEFSEALTRAGAEGEAHLSGLIAQAAKEDWRAAAFILERRFPESWGNRLALTRQFERMSEAELDAFLARKLAEADGAGENG